MKVAIPDTVMVNELGREGVLLDLSNGEYFSLDEVGMDMWRAFVRCGDIAAAHGELLGGYAVDSATLRRDMEAFARTLAARNLVRVAISITSLDRNLARSMEPRAATPEKRIDAVKRLTDAGIPTVVMFAPCIPGLNDHEMEAVLERAVAAGAGGAGYVALRLPLEIADLFQEWLATDHPDRAARVMSLVRQMRGGKTYDSQWGKRMKGDGPIAALTSRRFAVAKAKLGIAGKLPPLDLTQFRVPPKAGDQIDLFG